MTHSEGTQTRTHASLLFQLQETPDDQAAWSRFVNTYGPRVHAWCRRWGLQEADSADVTQDVLLRLAEKLREFRYDPSKRFRAWLKTVAHHAWSDFHRRNNRATLGTGESTVREVLDNIAAREDLTERLQAAFDHELLERAYSEVRGRVEDRTWQAFALTALHGLSGAEAARQIGMKVATVFVAKSKVQAMLQETLQRYEETP